MSSLGAEDPSSHPTLPPLSTTTSQASTPHRVQTLEPHHQYHHQPLAGYQQYGSPTSSSSPAQNVKAEDGSETTPKPKQKRNKPTLSCEECVERKTKCDRGRPSCLSCVKRQSTCHYTAVAELLNSANSSGKSKARYVTKPPIKAKKEAGDSPVMSGRLSRSASDAGLPIQGPSRKKHNSKGNSPFMLSHPPFSTSTPSNIFGVGSQHPFSNYWTCAGGIAEVVGVLPSKDQADILVAKYFEVVDPVYPCIHRRTFYTNYERFWASSPAEKNRAEADMLALHCTVYAIGTQFMPFPSYEERQPSSEFYASAANQALNIFSFLNRASLRTIVSMLLMTYFLMNDNHASDAYAWSGILLRQSYAMRLHRDPDAIDPNAGEVEKQVRRKLWQAVFYQDTFLTVILKLPPTATHSDVQPDSLVDEMTLQERGIHIDNSMTVNSASRVENLMSISVIAPPDPAPLANIPTHLVDPAVDREDVEFIRGMWKLGNLVQENISSPMSLALPLVSSPRQKTSLLSSFKALYRSFPSRLTILDPKVLLQHATTNPRMVRQNLFLNSNYYHCLMILQLAENEDAGVSCNVRGALEAAHEAIWAFFKLRQIFEHEAGTWWVFQHRAFEEATAMARMLSVPPFADSSNLDMLVGNCKADVERMVDVLKDSSRGNIEMQQTRLAVLQQAVERMII